ncbi:MAG: hypothetical protein ACI4N3_01020 [Alphaproteobacteria bacterium]
MKKNTPKKLSDLRKRIIAVLASNAFKAATLTPLALAMVACSVDTESEHVENIELEELQIKFRDDLAVDNTISAEDIRKGISFNVFVDEKTIGRKNLDELYNDYKDKEFNITVKDDEKIIYTMSNNNIPTDTYTFKKEETLFSVSGTFDGKTIGGEQPISVNSKNQGGNGSAEKPTDPTIKITPVTRALTLNDLNTISEEVSSSLTLTAQTIQLIGDISSGSLSFTYNEVRNKEDNTLVETETNENIAKAIKSQYNIDAIDKRLLDGSVSITKVENGKTLNRYIEINGNDSIDYGKFVFIQPNKGDVIHDNKTVPSYTISSPEITVNLSGDFNYNEIHIEKGDNLNIDNARFTIGDKYLLSSDAVLDLYKDINSLFGKNVNYENIIKANTDSTNENDYVFPELDFRIFDREYDNNSGEQIDNKKSLNIASLFKLYTQVANNQINKLNIKRLYNSTGDVTYDIDGRAYEKDNTTSLLFAEDGNTVKEDNVPNISIKTYFNLKQKYYSNISSVSNFKITNKDKYTSDEDINTTFRNVIFEDDMSGLTNSKVDQFHGVAYFKNKNYTIKNEKTNSSFKGVLKLDDLSNAHNIRIRANSNAVFDFRGVDTNYFLNYNIDYDYTKDNPNDKNFIKDVINAIYTKENIFDGKDSEEIRKIMHRFNSLSGGLENIFSGDIRVLSFGSRAHSRTPRSLEEFEYYGNNNKFEKSAKSSYDGYEKEFKALQPAEKEKLNDDPNNQIASNNRRVDFVDPETKKIIFSVLNDRQYNA